MKISVLGATGMAGSAIVTEAHTRGHHVTALSRNPTPGPNCERLVAQVADVADTDSLGPTLANADAVVLTIRLALGDESRLAPLTRGVLDTAAQHNTRVLVVGGAAPLRSPSHPDRLLIEDIEYVPEAWRTIAQASLDQFDVCQEHPYKGWVYLSPPAALESGEGTGRYRRGTTTLLTDANGTSRIVAPDLAIAVIDELENPGNDQHFTVVQEVPA